jgi:hypothetical protein
MSLADNPNSVMYVPPVLRAARRLIFEAGISDLETAIPHLLMVSWRKVSLAMFF